MAITPVIDAPGATTTRFEYLVVPLREAKSLKKDDEAWTPERLNELGEDGWRRSACR